MAGVRNVQHFEYVESNAAEESLIGVADTGDVRAEEVNFIEISDLLDITNVENFRWGRNADDLAREGTFHIPPRLPLVLNPDLPAFGAPSPDPGFMQPHAQYSRNDPNGGDAVNGPVPCGGTS